MASELTVGQEAKAVVYMFDSAKEHVDPKTGELRLTSLAEDTCDEFDLYGPAPEFDIPERLFELAFDVLEECQRRGIAL